MQPYQQRVIDEKTELDDKKDKLQAFFGTSLFQDVSPEEQDRMQRQWAAMDEYSSILGERIAVFAPVT